MVPRAAQPIRGTWRAETGGGGWGNGELQLLHRRQRERVPGRRQ